MMKILVADDSAIMRKIIGTNILKFDDKVELYQSVNGKETLKILIENSDIDIVFLDLKMPQISGHDVSNYLKQKNMKQVRIIAISSELTAENVEIFKQLGVTDFLSKPFDLAKFNALVVPILELYKKDK